LDVSVAGAAAFGKMTSGMPLRRLRKADLTAPMEAAGLAG